MSSWEPWAEDPNSPFGISADGHCFPPDPLLRSGAFIDADPDLNHAGPTPSVEQPAPDGVSESDRRNLDGADPPVRDEREPRERRSEDVSNSTNELPKSVDDGTESTPSGSKGAPQGSAESDSPLERPTWLPDGWRMICRVRSSGVTAGTRDRYYLEPVSGRRFRSKVEVEYFIQTGSKRKKKPSDADPNSSGSPGGRKQKKSGSKNKSPPPLNFDFNKVPEKVSWALTDAFEDQWTPFIDEKMVSQSSRKDWNAAFQLSSK